MPVMNYYSMLHIMQYLHVKVCLSQVLFTKREKFMIYTIWIQQLDHSTLPIAIDLLGVVVQGN